MNNQELNFWARMVSKGTMHAIASLSQLVGQDIQVTSFSLKQVEINEISELFGGSDAASVGVYLTVSGSANGNIMLMYDPAVAYGFIDMLMGQPPGTTTALGEMETSALGELGNIVGGSYLNALADSAGIRLLPSPPKVLQASSSVLLSLVLADAVLTQEQAYVAETTYTAPDREISGRFLVVPSQELLQTLFDAKDVA